MTLKDDASRLRARSLVFICIAALIASQPSFAIEATAVKSPQSQVRTARIVLQLDVEKASRAVWCYDTEPAFVFSTDRSVLRYDTSGKLIEKLDLNFSVGSIFCSDDGKVLYFTRGERWWIYSSQSGLSEYAVALPKLYNSGVYSKMSADGRSFALPSAPTLVSGTDVLHDTRVVQTGGRQAFWTKDILFVETAERNSFRMLRSSDLSELGVLKLDSKPNRLVHGIFECGTSYFVLYWKDDLQRRDLERINDRRLGASGAPAKYVDVGGVDKFRATCTVPLMMQDARGAVKLKSAVILENGVQERIEFPKARTLGSAFVALRDRRLILGLNHLERRVGEVITGGNPTRVVVLGIEK